MVAIRNVELKRLNKYECKTFSQGRFVLSLRAEILLQTWKNARKHMGTEERIDSSIHSFKNFLMRIYYVPGTMLGRGIVMQKTDMMPILTKHP